MCATPYRKCQALLAVLAADVAAHAKVVAVPVVGAKAIWSAPMPGAVVGAPTAVAALPTAVAKMGRAVGAPAPVAKKAKVPVAREAKASKECAPATADVVVSTEVVAVPAPVAKAPQFPGQLLARLRQPLLRPWLLFPSLLPTPPCLCCCF